MMPGRPPGQLSAGVSQGLSPPPDRPHGRGEPEAANAGIAVAEGGVGPPCSRSSASGWSGTMIITRTEAKSDHLSRLPMARIQSTLVQIDTYPPWTLTPEPRCEAGQQALPVQLYADLVHLVGAQSGSRYFTRFDDVNGLTNGLTLEDHARIRDPARDRYSTSVSPCVATGRTPTAARSRGIAGLLTFSVAGDTVIAVSPGFGMEAYRRTGTCIEPTVGIPPQVGIGQGSTARRAGTAATGALEACRHPETRVEETGPGRYATAPG